MILRKLLYLEDSPLRSRIAKILGADGPDLILLEPRKNSWSEVVNQTADLVIVRLASIPPPAERTIQTDLSIPSEPPSLVVLTEKEDPVARAALLAAGCEAVLNENLPSKSLAKVLSAFLAKRRDQKVRLLPRAWENDAPRLDDFSSRSPLMAEFMGVVRRLVDTDASLLILGETGVGKERLARAIHASSPRRFHPFVTLNCGALPETLLESELFGHEKGAFTGAHRVRKGWIETADGGALFLDEIGEMPLHLQVKLLRVLQDRTFQRLGGERDHRVNIRIMAATNRDLEAEVESGGFRRDLYYRLSVVTLNVPPLRERSEDIPELAARFTQHFARALNRDVTGLSPEAEECLVRYHWPGNIRELMNLIERAVILCRGDVIQPEDLPQSVSRGRLGPDAAYPRGLADLPPAASWADRPWKEVREEGMARLEKRYLEEILNLSRGRIGEAASRAGVNPRSLYEKMREHGLRKEDFK